MSELLKLGEKLSAAIQAGDTNEAVILATLLSNMKLKIDVNINKDEIEQRNRENEFSVRVHIEDRLSDGFYLDLQVKSCDTIQDLKRKVMLKHGFPEEVQRWIIGKKLPDDDNKLSQCGVKGPGHTLFLYLVTARSVGLSKEEFEAKRQALYRGISVTHKQSNQAGLHSPVQRESPESYWPGPLSPQETESHSCSNNQSPVLSPSSELGMGEVEGHSPYAPSRQTSKKSLTSGSSMLQEIMLMAPNLSSLPAAESRHKQVPVERAENELGLWESGYESRPAAGKRLNTPAEIEKIGWVCTTCTYINLPIRPGCEMCTGPRPAGYKIPSGYMITPEERQLLENDQLLEKMTREAQTAVKHERASPWPNHYRVTHEQLQENIQWIDTLTTHTNDDNNNINHRNSSVNNQAVGNNYVFIPEGADWDNLHEITEREGPAAETRHSNSHRRRGHGSVAAPPSTENHRPFIPRPTQRIIPDVKDIFLDVAPNDDLDFD